MMQDEIRNELNELGSTLGSKGREMPMQAPEGYFEGLAERMTRMAADTEDLRMARIDMPYKVPAGYFDTLPGKVMERTGVVQKKGILISFRQLRWAAAAVLFIMAGIGGYQMFYGNEAPRYEQEILANVEDGDIQEYLADAGGAKPDAGKGTSIDKMDIAPADIIVYLDETGWDNEYY
ncbi:hypothetical protein GCM10023093_22400 [Nemorincola caseinilytica]|uniref:Uncharacterized protein n=1 Tax=Nemorincola caseinilytica TaxID=2054315 RepID=A0ABP8NIU8_9BACT